MSKTETKSGRVARDFTHEDQSFKQGAPITLPANQFDDFEACGLVEAAAAKAEAAPPAKA